MANDKNLVPNSQRTPSERRENASKAGKASGEARRANKTLKAILQDWAKSTPSEDDKEKLRELGITSEGVTRKALLLVPILNRVNQTLDLNAAKLAIQLLNEDDKYNAEVNLLRAEVNKLKTENELLLQKVNETGSADVDDYIKVIFDNMDDGGEDD